MFELLGDGGEVLDFFFKVRQHTFLRQSVRSCRGWLGGLKHQGILLATSGLVVQSGPGAGCEHNCIYFISLCNYRSLAATTDRKGAGARETCLNDVRLHAAVTQAI